MLGLFRGVLATWPARIFFLLLASAFALWGVANKNPFGSDSGAVATIGSQHVQMPELQQAYRQGLAQVSRMYGEKGELPPEVRRGVAAQALDRVVTQAALQQRIESLGIAVPDEAVRTAAYAIPQFRGPDGKFDRATMQRVLHDNNLTEPHFLDLLHAEVAQRQLMGAITGGATPSETMARQLFAFQHELRTAQVAELPFATAAPPAAPTDEQLKRWYDNHPESYSTPEYRKIKAVVLSPETVGKEITVSDDDLRAAYEQHKAEFTTPDKRAVQVLTFPDEDAARKLATQWLTGADWDTMQAAAKASGASSVAIDASTRDQFPSPELADAAFAVKTPDTVAPPVKGSLGWYVLKVTATQLGGTTSFDEARQRLHDRMVADKAADLIDQRASKIDDLLAGGADLDHLPGDMGLGAVTGTMDAQGNTPTGEPAPIPGSYSLRAALTQAAFQAHVGDAAKQLVQAQALVPNEPPSYYAASVESVTPPAPKPFDKVADQVRADWTRDAVRHARDEQASKILGAVQAGQSLSDAAAPSGAVIRALPPTGRENAAEAVPAALVQPLFGLRKGGATMVETPDGFDVAVLTDVSDPDPKSDPVGFGKLRDGLARGLGEDAAATFAAAVRDQARPTINKALVDSLTQASE